MRNFLRREMPILFWAKNEKNNWNREGFCSHNQDLLQLEGEKSNAAYATVPIARS